MIGRTPRKSRISAPNAPSRSREKTSWPAMNVWPTVTPLLAKEQHHRLPWHLPKSLMALMS
ncbi:hypothetical protein ABZX51_003773 [Aspergillus tubingensis]